MAYYELTNGCELTFADIKCQYFFGPPPEVAAKEEGSSCEQTQAYDFGEEDMAGSEREEGGRNGGLSVEGGAEEAGKEEGGLVASESHAGNYSRFSVMGDDPWSQDGKQNVDLVLCLFIHSPNLFRVSELESSYNRILLGHFVCAGVYWSDTV